MKSISLRSVAALLGSSIVLLAAFTTPAAALPDTDQNAGIWTDGFSDGTGLEEGSPSMVNGEPGRSGVVHDPFGRLITLASPATPGHFYTKPINPSSFSAWGKLYISFTAATLTDVKVGLYARPTAGTATLLVDPLNYAPLQLVPSDDPAYSRMVYLPPFVAASVTKFGLRIGLSSTNTPQGPLAPTIKSLKVTWVPKSLLSVSLESPATKQAGDGIVVRVNASVSYVNAKDFVAWVTAPPPTAGTAPYNPAGALSFVSATEGGQWSGASGTGAPLNVPANSVYWSKPSLLAGTTFSYFATFRSQNGIENKLEYKFQGHLKASNSPSVIDSNFDDTVITSTARGYLDKTSSGTFIIGTQAYARKDALITMRLTAGDWVFTPIPNGAQDWNEAVVYDSVQDFITKGAITAGNPPTSIAPLGGATIPAISNISNPGSGVGLFTQAAIPGLGVPANSVYWVIPRLQLGNVSSLSYQIQLNGSIADDNTLANSVTINSCAGNANEAGLVSGQGNPNFAGAPDATNNPCIPGTAGACQPVLDCHSIIIHVNNTPGYVYAKGDMLNGITSIQGGVQDNEAAFVTYGDPITFKLSVGNSALSKLNDIVMYDRVPTGTTFASASLPASANGTVWYYIGAPSVGPPAFFQNPSNPADDTKVPGSWTASNPGNASVTWVAYWIPGLASTYFPEAPPSGSPSSVVADFTVTVNTNTGDVCVPSVVENTGHFFFPRYTPLSPNAESAFLGGAQTRTDVERVDVRPIVPNLQASAVSGPPSAVPGTTQVWYVNVFNHDRNQNPVDIALNATAVIQIPQLVANGQARRPTFFGADTAGGSLVRTYDNNGDVASILVTWPSGILPQQTKQVKLTLGLPLGIRDSSNVLIAANLAAQDNFGCTPINANPSYETTINSSPVLEVRKDVDLTVVAQGSTYHYALRYVNRGTAPSTETWVIDRLPEGLTITSGRGTATGQVWFASDLLLNPSNPLLGYIQKLDPNPNFDPNLTFDDNFVRSRFTRSTVRPDAVNDPGRYTPTIANAKWVAFLVDDPNFNPAVTPPILGVGNAGILDVTVAVKPTTPIGTVLQNEALIDSSELLQSIGNRVVTVVSGRPGLDLVKTCPEVISNDEGFDYRISWINDTTNQNDTVTLVETFPVGFVPNDLSLHNLYSSTIPSPTAITETIATADGPRLRATWTFPPQGSLGEAFIEIPGKFVGATSNTYKSNDVVGIAENDAGSFSTSHTCTTLIENPELKLLKFVDILDPRSNESVTFTLTVSNEHSRGAHDVTVTDTLPAGLTLVGDPTSQTPGWSVRDLKLDSDPQTLELRFYRVNDSGVLPGNSGPLTATFVAKVDASINPGTKLTNNALVTGQPGEDPPATPNPYPNSASVFVTTPLPDPYVTLTAPLLVKPGENLTWNIQYGNGTREDAEQTVILLTFPEGPTTDGAADFSYVAHTVPPGVSVYFSTPDVHLGDLTFANFMTWPVAPGLGWTTTAPTNTDPVTPPGVGVNYMLFVIDNDIAALSGPFPITVTATAIKHDSQLVNVGQTFVATAQIGMIDVDYPEVPSGAANNFASATTRTPATDMSVTVDCTPDGDELGVLPDAITEFTFTIANTGTVNAYGIYVDAALDGILTLESHSGSAVSVTNEDGFTVGPVNNIGAIGTRIETPVSWTAEPQPGTNTTRFYLGNLGGDAYRQVGLRPGDTATITVRARTAAGVLNNVPFNSTAKVTTIGVTDLDADDEILTNDARTCGSKVYRADPFVIKSVRKNCFNRNQVGVGILDMVRSFSSSCGKDVYGITKRDSAKASAGDFLTASESNGSSCYCDSNETNIVDAGDTLIYTVQYGNSGDYEASDVVITDDMPIGTTYRSGSLDGIPATATGEYHDGSFVWDPAETDPVAALRIRWNDGEPLLAPANRSFYATTQRDFYDDYNYNYDSSNVDILVEGSVVPGQVPESSDFAGTYTSPPFPDYDEGQVIRWGKVISESNATSDQNLTIDVLDQNGTTILTDVIKNGDGTYDLSGISPLEHPRLKLKANLAGGNGQCMVDMVPGDRFKGYPTAVGETSDHIIGFQARELDNLDDENWTAWVHSQDWGLTDLHQFLPSYEIDASGTWDQSFPTDIDSNDTIVGWADPNKQNEFLIQYIDDQCLVALPASLYVPNGSDRKVGSGIGTGFNAQPHMQWVITPAQLGDAAINISEIRLRDRFTQQGIAKHRGNVTVKVGYANSSSAIGDGATWSFNYSAVPPTTVFDGGSLDWTQPQGSELAFNVRVPFNSPFFYEPQRGALVIELIQAPGTGASTGEASFDADGCTDASPYRLGYASTHNATGPAQGGYWSCPLTTQVIGTQGKPGEALMAWRPSSGSVPLANLAGSASNWEATCLPPPDSLNQTTPYDSRKPVPTMSVVHINERGNIAATYGIARTIPNAGRTLGTATVWCPNVGGAFEYDATAIKYLKANPTGALEPVLAPPALVTGQSENDTVIGIGRIVEANGTQTKAYAWTPEPGEGGCTDLWKQHDLTESLRTLISQTPEWVFPIDIDANGNIIGLYGVKAGDTYLAYWTLVSGAYVAHPVSDDVVNANAYRAITGARAPKFPQTVPVNTTRSIVDGVGYFMTQVDGVPSAYQLDVNAFSWTMAIPSGQYPDIVTGAGHGVALGAAIAPDGDLFSYNAWANFDGEVVELGTLDDSNQTVPLYVNQHELVVGAYRGYDGTPAGHPRVFKWERCVSGIPALQAWGVTYETNRPPQFTFEVTVDDYCQPKITNKVDITTSTPEITTENNHSEVSIPLNRADLEVAVSANVSVTTPATCTGCTNIDSYVEYSALLTNNGAGTSRDVEFTFRMPDQDDFAYNPYGANVVGDLGASWYHYPDGPGNVTVVINAFDPGEEILITWGGYNRSNVPGEILTASSTVDARTVDCIADNDIGSVGVLVGDFPNLWVELSGPTVATTSETATYVITYGNSGNVPSEDANVTFQPPVGMTFISASVPPRFPAPFTYPIWDVGDIDPQEGGTITVTYGAPGCNTAGDGGFLDAFTHIAGAGFESSIDDNDALVSTYVVPGSGSVALDTVSSHTSAQDGEAVAQTVYFNNSGGSAIGGAVLRVGIPGGKNQYVAGSASLNGVLQGNEVVWNLGTLEERDAGSVTFRYTKVAGASTTTATLDSIGACDTTVNIVPPGPKVAGLNIFKSASVGTVCGEGAGAKVGWSILVTNDSGTDIGGVIVADTIPAGMTYTGNITGVGANASNPAVLTWNVGIVAAHSTVSLGYDSNVTATVTGVLRNPATAVFTPPAGPLERIEIPGGIASYGAVGIDCEPTATISKGWTGACQLAGTAVGIDLKVTNTSNIAIKNGKLSDHLPAGFDIILPNAPVAPASAFAYDTSGRTLTFTVATLLPGASQTFSFMAMPNGSAQLGRAITNRAALKADGFLVQTSNQVAGAFLDCNDGNACTIDSCNAGGCTHVAISPLDTAELCGNGIDDNCNGVIDTDFTGTYYGLPLTAQCDSRDDPDQCKTGVVVCSADGKTAECNDPASDDAAKVETCNEFDDDCDGTTDEDFTFGPTRLPVGFVGCDGDDNGTCATGTVTCNNDDNGTVCIETGINYPDVACSVGLGVCKVDGFKGCDGNCNVAPISAQGRVELCGNGFDDNCNGTIDTDFSLIGRIGVACDSTESDRNGGDADHCIGGVYICDTVDRTQVTCDDDAVSIPEVCDGSDNDCDGLTDEGYTIPGVLPNTTLAIGQACDGTDGDKCNGGFVVCAGLNAAECSDNNATIVEACNGVDDDCDGLTDELWTQQGFDDNQTTFAGPYLGVACDGTNDVDLCKLGKIECNLDFTATYCHEQDVGVVELCNGQDDECECGGAGQPECTAQYIDEGFDIGKTCTVGLGACLRTGAIACTTTTASACNAAVVTGVPETCNAIDDDCDGTTDEPAANGALTCLPLETDILTGPPALTSSTTAVFTYVNPVSVPVAAHTTFECKLDGGAWVTCNHVGATPSLTYSNLPQGQHTLLVRATRSDGAVDPTPDFWSWIIDTTVPDTTILSGPTNPSQNPSGTFAFGSPTPNPDFYMCVLDPTGGVCPPTGAGTYGLCPASYPYTNLADGSHTICVYVTNTAGTPDPLPASYTWTIDTIPPETEIVTVIPPKLTSSTSIVLHYIDPTAPTTNTFECSLDGAIWKDCDGKTTSYTGLTEGEHFFEVRTIDPNGVIDPTPATFSWVIDQTGPCPTIATNPSDPAQSDSAIFGFTASEVGVSYFCALDPTATQLGPNGQPVLAAYTACNGTVAFSDLADGTHTLWVYAKDGAANVGTCRASYTWLIDSRFPETEITEGPTPLIGTGEVSLFDYIDPTDEDLITFECSLDGKEFVRCDGLVVGDGGTTDYDNLPIGKHTFLVRACDFTKAAAVQCDPTPAIWIWEVTTSPCPNDRTAPAIDCKKDIVLECVAGGAEIDLVKLTPIATDACEPVLTTTSASADVVLGQTPLVFTSQDPNGNISSCVTLVNVVDTGKPSITCPPDLAVATDRGVCTAAADIVAATGTDSCQGNVGLLILDDAPEFFIPGTTMVTHHVIDSFGNDATCEQEVTVTDEEELVLTCTDSLTVDADADKCEWSGIQSALATDNCSDELTVDVDGTYRVGVSPILFTAADAAGNSAECTTELTVRDVTKPVVLCGTAVGVLPTVIRATATDACVVTVALENVVCNRVVNGSSTPIAIADCPITINGDAIEITGRLTEGELTITYDARAVDASGNFAMISCSEAYDPDKDGDGIVDAEDNCVLTANGDQGDSDDDGIGNACDNCPDTANEDQADVDGDGIGNVCSDRDKDGVLDAADNCPDNANTNQLDIDGDELGDACDDAPYEGLTAEGSGGCAGGGAAGGLLGGLMGLVGIFAAMRARRR